MASSTEKQNGSLRQRRASPAQLSPSLTDSVKTRLEDSLLLFWDDLPDWRRDNAFIVSGYRQSRASYFHAFQSLFYMHNESVNIWSHLLGAIVAFVSAAYLYAVIHPRYNPATRADVLVFACFFGGAVLCLGMSATFHALIDHSPSVMKWGNKLDYTGIVALIVGSNVPAMHYGFSCKPDLQFLYTAVVSVLLV